MTIIRKIKTKSILNKEHSAEKLLKLIDNIIANALKMKAKHDRESECNDITWKAYSVGASTALKETIDLIEEMILEIVDVEDNHD